jgi:ribokinase
MRCSTCASRPAGPIRHGGDVPAEIRIGPGGQGANLAVRLARQGVEVDLVCALGDDPAAEIVRAALGADRVHLRELRAEATGTVVILGGADGERTMLSQRAPFAERVAGALAGEAPWLVVSGYLLLEPAGGQVAGVVAATTARRVLVGCAVPDPLAEAWRAAALAMRPDLLVLNRDEVDRLDLGPVDGMAITHAGGAVVSIGEAVVEVETPAGPPAVDTAGAGDAFTAGLVAGLLDEAWPPPDHRLEDAVRHAVGLAAAVARAPGAQARVAGERPGRLAR